MNSDGVIEDVFWLMGELLPDDQPIGGRDTTMGLTLSVIIPVHNGGTQLVRTLEALINSTYSPDEIIVVDDGSSDDSPAIAARFGAVVLYSGRCAGGPAHARNIGARYAKSDILLFIDADCAVQPETVARVLNRFEGADAPTALIGTYDDSPAETNFLSQYKNLIHAYVHRSSAGDVSSFWGGCGAILRNAFISINGFDSLRFRRPSIEDIEMGYRLTDNGGRIALDPQVQVKHLKRWTLPSLLRTDLMDRAIPWTQLLHETKRKEQNLNLQFQQKLSVVLIYLSMICLVGSLVSSVFALITLLLLTVVTLLNVDVYAFFARQRGLWFALRVVPLHWLYYAYSGLGFMLGTSAYAGAQIRQRWQSSPIRPGTHFTN